MLKNAAQSTQPAPTQDLNQLKQVADHITKGQEGSLSLTTKSTCDVINKAKLWHLRLGHMPIHRLKVLFPDLDENLIKSKIFCTICPKARQTRTCFPRSSTKATKPLELLHIDVWGPLKYHTRTNCNSFITIVDDFSRMTWIYLIKRKSEFASVIQQFILFIERQLNTKVKCIRTENAMELTKGEASNFYNSLGILNQSSYVDTPQQNEVVERKHKHILEVARSLMFHSKLPIKF